MKTLELKLTRIGNSKGVRLPVELIERYGFSGFLAAEPRQDGLLLKARKQSKLTWEETAASMAASNEDWSEWESANADGLGSSPWDASIPVKRGQSLEAAASHRKQSKKEYKSQTTR